MDHESASNGIRKHSSEHGYMDNAGPSRLLREVVHGDIESQDDIVIEEEAVGRVVRLENINGEYYIMVDGDDNGIESDLIVGEAVDIDSDVRGNNCGAGSGSYEDEDGRDGTIQIIEDQEDMDDVMDAPHRHSLIMEPVPQGLKSRKNRQYGNCRCPECGASFINQARLDRHLAVHQVFGSYLCPLCGKTYKYEYNLFFHWRKTCRDLNELVPPEQRQTMDVNELRHLVEEVAQKKTEIGPIEIGIARSGLLQHGPTACLEMPSNPLGRRGTACRGCGVVVSSSHMPRHLALHRGEVPPGQRSVSGGFVCDLCGLVFRQQFNLIKHWRTSCPEIQANLPEDEDLTLDDSQLRDMVSDLLKRAVTVELDNLPGPKRFDYSGHPLVADRDVKPTLNDDGDSNQIIVDDGIYDEDVNVTAEHHQSHESGMSWGNVYADDFGGDDDDGIVGENGQVVHGGLPNKAKWKMGSAGVGVQCPECFRAFANTGRLERHLAGFHASFGSHHCVLCGNRFKYDYNLLYHYRKSCPYTKHFIDRDVREQMDAMTLRKLVRGLAEKEVRLSPQIKPETMRLMNLRKGATHNDMRTRKEMLKYPVHGAQPPPQLLQPRNGLSDARPCPVCGIVFYGDSAVTLHVQARHPGSSGDGESADVRSIHLQDGELDLLQFDSADGTRRYISRTDNHIMEYIDENDLDEDDGPIEPPPLLERQEPTEDNPAVEVEQVIDTILKMKAVDIHGDEVDVLKNADLSELPNSFESGQVNAGDHIFVMEDEVEFAFQLIEFVPPNTVIVARVDTSELVHELQQINDENGDVQDDIVDTEEDIVDAELEDGQRLEAISTDETGAINDDDFDGEFFDDGNYHSNSSLHQNIQVVDSSASMEYRGPSVKRARIVLETSAGRSNESLEHGET